MHEKGDEEAEANREWHNHRGVNQRVAQGPPRLGIARDANVVVEADHGEAGGGKLIVGQAHRDHKDKRPQHEQEDQRDRRRGEAQACQS